MEQTKPTENVSILLADDNDTIRKSMADFLLGSGYFVTEARTGNEALRYFREIQPDLIITDLRLPEMDGLEFIEIVTKESEFTPCIIISGEGNMQNAIKGLRLGAWDYLNKPVYPLDLLKHSVDRALERVRLLRESRHYKKYLEDTVEQRTADLLTQNRRLEQQIQERRIQEKLVLEAQNEWERTVNSLPDMIAIVDSEHRVIRCNQSMQEKLGKPLAEIIGRDCLKCKDAFPCLHKELMKDKKPRRFEIYHQAFGTNYSVDIIPYYSKDDKLIGSIHVFRDITELKKSFKEKEILQAQLLQAHKLESVGQLAAGIAHEINTPTQFISSNVGFISDAFLDVKKIIDTFVGAAEESARSPTLLYDALQEADWPYLETEIPKAIKQSQEGLARVTAIVRAMKEFSHPGGNYAEPTDINHIIETTLTVARNEWKYSSEVVLNLAPDLPVVDCIADSIGQTLLNLLVNAAHSITEKLGKTPEGGKGKITIETRVEGSSVLIHIADTGCGIAKSNHAKIFDPFFTTKEVGRGTGQGLAIAYDVVARKHGGSLTFTTVLGEGTTFIIRLPIKRRLKE